MKYKFPTALNEVDCTHAGILKPKLQEMSTLIEKMDADEEEGPGLLEESFDRKKRKKYKREEFLKLPTESTDGLPSEAVDELQAAYQILQAILLINKIEPFLDKPNDSLFGMSAYYTIIKKPMWLNEVLRKLMEKEYSGIREFVADVRLILENCYRFWGPTHKFSRKALYIEHKLERKLSILPEMLQEKCLDPELNANEVIVKTEIEDDIASEDHETVNNVLSVRGFESKILNRILESSEGQPTPEDIEEQNQKEAEMLSWEREHLVDEEHRTLISSMWQLAEIGSFLKMTWEVLNVEEITQYEVERMLLMPQESTTLATLMTSMLSPQMLRAKLDVTPVMPYEIWTSRLKKKIDNWFDILYSSRDELEAFSICGVEPHFWAFVGLLNPLQDKRFHEIPFFKRVYILKALCDCLLHYNKPIQDIFLDESNSKELRPIYLGSDKNGNSYVRIPFYREVRVYKQAKSSEDIFDDCEELDSGLSHLLEAISEPVFNEKEDLLEFLPNQNYCVMVADSLETLDVLTESLRKSKLYNLSKNISKDMKLFKKERKNIDGLLALYNQWHEYRNRSQEYFSNLLNLWLASEKPRDAQQAIKSNESLGKRKSTRYIDFSSLRSTDSEDDSEYESSSVSDWESTYRHKKKKKIEKRRRRKRSAVGTSESDGYEEAREDSMDFSEELPVIMKQESVDIKPEIVAGPVEGLTMPEIAGVMSGPQPAPVRPLSPGLPPAYVVVKKEKEDVIYISSDEEKESGAVAAAGMANSRPPNPVRNGIPPRAPGPPPSHTALPQLLSRPPQSQPLPTPRANLFNQFTTASSKLPQPIVIPQPIQERRVPQPIPEPMMPKPIAEPVMPKPMLDPSSPRQPTWSPRMMSPRAPRMMTPRMRSPVSPMGMRTPPTTSPRSPMLRGSPMSPGRPRNPAVRNLFPPQPAANVPTVEGILEIGQKPDGSYGYHVRLPDGGIINMSRHEIEEIRGKNNGVLPVKLEVPLVRNKKF